MSKRQRGLKVLPKLIGIMLARWPVLFVGLLGLILGAGVNLLLPDIGRRILDQDPLFAGWGLEKLAFLFVVIFAIQGVFFYIRSYAFHRLAIVVSGDLRERLFASLLTQPISFFDKVVSGDLLSRVTSDIALVQGLLGIHVSVLLRYGTQILVGLVMMLLASPTLSAYVLLLIPVLVLPSIGLIGRLRRYSKAQQQALGDASALAGEAFTGIRVLKSFYAEWRFSKLFSGLQKKITEISSQRAGVSSFFSSFVGFLMNSCLVALLFIGFQEVLKNGLRPGGLLAFLLYGGIVAVSFAFFSNSVSDFVQALGALERVMEFLGAGKLQPPRISTEPRTVPSIELRDVSFAYRADAQAALNGASIRFDGHQSTAVVGASGSGKSSLVNMIVNWYRPNSGEVLINGEVLSEQSAYRLLNSIAVVPQDTQLFSLSVRENIEIAAAEGSDLSGSIRDAELTEVIKALPEGMETKLGERGGRLSGGQRQRIALARALASSPVVLVIDEGLSGLDPLTEGAVLKTIRAKCGVIFVTHRLASIMDFDRIVVMENGSIVGDGTHQELIASCPQYRVLVENSKTVED